MVVITRVTLICTLVNPVVDTMMMTRYEGDWVAGLREGKGKYLSKATGEKMLLLLHQVLLTKKLWLVWSQGENMRESMRRT